MVSRVAAISRTIVPPQMLALGNETCRGAGRFHDADDPPLFFEAPVMRWDISGDAASCAGRQMGVLLGNLIVGAGALLLTMAACVAYVLARYRRLPVSFAELFAVGHGATLRVGIVVWCGFLLPGAVESSVHAAVRCASGGAGALAAAVLILSMFVIFAILMGRTRHELFRFRRISAASAKRLGASWKVRLLHYFEPRGIWKWPLSLPAVSDGGAAASIAAAAPPAAVAAAEAKPPAAAAVMAVPMAALAPPTAAEFASDTDSDTPPDPSAAKPVSLAPAPTPSPIAVAAAGAADDDDELLISAPPPPKREDTAAPPPAGPLVEVLATSLSSEPPTPTAAAPAVSDNDSPPPPAAVPRVPLALFRAGVDVSAPSPAASTRHTHANAVAAFLGDGGDGAELTPEQEEERDGYFRFIACMPAFAHVTKNNYFYLLLEMAVRVLMIAGSVASEVVPASADCYVARATNLAAAVILLAFVALRNVFIERTIFWAVVAELVCEAMACAMLVADSHTGADVAPPILMAGLCVSVMALCGAQEVYLLAAPRVWRDLVFFEYPFDPEIGPRKRKQPEQKQPQQHKQQQQQEQLDSAAKQGAKQQDNAAAAAARKAEVLVDDVHVPLMRAGGGDAVLRPRAATQWNADSDLESAFDDDTESRAVGRSMGAARMVVAPSRREEELDLFEQMDRRVRAAFYELMNEEMEVVPSHRKLEEAKETFVALFAGDDL